MEVHEMGVEELESFQKRLEELQRGVANRGEELDILCMDTKVARDGVPPRLGYGAKYKQDFNSLSLKVNTTKGWWERKASEIDADELAKKKAKQVATWDEKEWVAEPEQGVLITLVPQIDGSNYLKKIRFSQERFGELNAREWWDENKARLLEQYL
ncbi:Protein Brevis radix-like 2 [Dendrobium catenatum]|uniref:Protein Brevis radix-like 2 n=1 Tax=Dendrobium catenatum TaxID=906689 RepID=A0A2I0X1Z4_9ASPA|nr:Protein Brevis radix-like 2 [Dendrobium catenatum]